MGKRFNRRKYRRRRWWAGFFLLVSLALVVFGVQFLMGMGSPDLQPTASRTAEKVGVERVKSLDVADAPEAIGGQNGDEAALLAKEEEDKKTAAEKEEVKKKAAPKADEKEAVKKQAAQRAQKPDPQSPAIPTPPTDDLWFSIPALGLY